MSDPQTFVDEELKSLGLWGDGDEIRAVEEAFRVIDLDVPVEDAPGWLTVGDLWSSVQRLAPDTAERPEAWDAFRRVLSQETGIDWQHIGLTTKVLDGKGHSILQRIFMTFRERIGKRSRDNA